MCTKAATAPVLKEANVKRESTLTPRMVPSTNCCTGTEVLHCMPSWVWLCLIHAVVDEIPNLTAARSENAAINRSHSEVTGTNYQVEKFLELLAGTRLAGSTCKRAEAFVERTSP